MDKPFKILCSRAGMIGDSISALTLPVYFRKLYPNSWTIWAIGKKYSQSAPIYINHPAISEIFVYDGAEGPESERDWNMIRDCQWTINPNPQHPDNRYPQEFNIYSESWRMAGLDIKQWNRLTEEERRPKLHKWFNLEPRLYNDKKIIAVWGFASYGNKEQKRNPTKEWYYKLFDKLLNEGYIIAQFGHPNDPKIYGELEREGYFRFNHLDFFQQIKMTLSTDVMLGTDSGSSLIMAAYEFPQVTLLTDHWGNTDNPYALAPDNPKSINLFASGGCDNISIDLVLESIQNKLK